MASFESLIVLAVVLTCDVILSITGNTLTLFILIRNRKLRKPHLYIPAALCIVDIISVMGWTTLTISALITGSWGLPDEVCILQNYVMTFCNANNMHMFLLLAVERAIKFLKPSKHRLIFIPHITICLIGAVLFIDVVIATFPALGWGKIIYYSSQYQCIPEFQLSTSHMNFLFVAIYVIPLLALSALLILSFIKLQTSRRKVVPHTGAIVLEENKESTTNSYAYNVDKNNKKFKNAGRKIKKPRVKANIFTDNGYVSDSDDSGEETQLEQVDNKQIYLLSETDHDFLKSYVIIIFVYVMCWMPYVILSYTWTYARYVMISDWLLLLSVALTHCTSLIKPVVFLFINKKLTSIFRSVVSIC